MDKSTNTMNGRKSNSLVTLVIALLCVAVSWGSLDSSMKNVVNTTNILEEQLEIQKTTISTLNERVSRLEEKLTGIETQFDHFADVSNIRYQANYHLIQILWGRTSDEELPNVDYWPFNTEDRSQ